MTSAITFLIASAAFAVTGAVGTLISALHQDRSTAVRIARLGAAGGLTCAGILAILLNQQNSGPNKEIRSQLWTWLSFSLPQSPSISFGLAATILNAALVCLFGILELFALWKANSNPDRPLSTNDIVAISFLYAGGTLFVFAPNTAQAFLGWCVVSSLAAIQLWKPNHGRPREKPANIRRWLLKAGNTFEFLERLWSESIWKPLTKRFPEWLGEQADDIEAEYNSLQTLATVLGTSAILLTWLL